MAREVNEGMVLRMHELRLGSQVAGVFHGVGRVDHVHLQQRQTGSLSVSVRKDAVQKLTRTALLEVAPRSVW